VGTEALWTVSIGAFGAVMVLLGLLAAAMALLTRIFPGAEPLTPAATTVAASEGAGTIDAATVAAITLGVAALAPGLRVQRIQGDDA
jgi:hypothetical protein